MYLASSPAALAATVPPSSRLNPLLAVGVALAGAGLVAAGPVSPAASITQRALHLTDAWSTLVDGLESNFTDLQNALTSDPLPILTQLGANLQDYGQLMIGMENVPLNLIDEQADGHIKYVTSGAAGFIQGVEQMVNGSDNAPGLVELLQGLVSGGDPLQAFSDLDTWFLFGIEGLLKPLVPVATIPEDMLQNFTAVLTNMVGPEALWDVGKALFKAVSEPLIGVGFQFSEILGDATTSGGDPLTALTDAPAELLNALLNGYSVPPAPGADEGSQFIGLLSAGGTFESLLQTFPERIAEAMQTGTSQLDGATPVSLTDLFSGLSGGSDDAGLLSLLNLGSIGDDSSLTDLLSSLDLSDLFGSSFDFSDIGDFFTGLLGL